MHHLLTDFILFLIINTCKQTWICKKKRSNKRRYRKGNPGQLGRKNEYPAGYNDKKQKGKKGKCDNSAKRKSTNIQMNEKVDKTKKQKPNVKVNNKTSKGIVQKQTRKTRNSIEVTLPAEIALVVRDDDSFLAGISQQSIQTFGMYIVMSLFLVNIC
jgi:hypothetical protein